MLVLHEELHNDVNDKEQLKKIREYECKPLFIFSETVSTDVSVHEVAHKDHATLKNYKADIPTS